MDSVHKQPVLAVLFQFHNFNRGYVTEEIEWIIENVCCKIQVLRRGPNPTGHQQQVAEVTVTKQSSPLGRGEVVCVTGGSGCIGSWVVRLLLDRNYTVHATVKDLKDEGETKHLEALEGAATRLRLFQIDLLDYNSIFAAINGCSGVFHLASPCIVDQVQDPEKELLDPAIKGTLNVLTAAKQAGVIRVVLTSSISAITPSPRWPSDKIKGEDCWTDIDYCKQKGLWYPLSKTLAEKAAWEFAKEKELDVVVVNPGTVMGDVISPRLNASMVMLVRLLEGCTETYENFFMGSVHFKDVALAHILVYENKSATGRHLCVEAISHYGDFVAKVAELYPEYKVPSLPKDTQPGLLREKNGAMKLMNLGLEFIPMDQIIKDAVESLKSKGFIS
ncbi:NAD(P)-binding Rossmann-fold superfamily protein [Prunus dulcis]|uniref:NAD(P)-binding Rossmann-fold superfamily protein n=1 Tax=Prunus dulcis TaxID=3755 RepID=A0A4Y1RK39_PRUDU|nr:NAD(P)-binding Rossmann-fold superfamily protein [Prunus dulcis]